MTALKADLHLHSTASDGMLSPAEVVRRAAEKGCTHLALTDHDSVSGIAEARRQAEASGLFLVPGVEMSCGGDKEIHVLGYGFDPDNEAVRAFCRSKAEERRTRVEKMVRQLEDNGISVSLESVMEIARGVPGRAHLARVLVHEGYATSVRNAFDRYLAQGRCGFVPKRLFTVREAAALMEQAGGIAVLAHPMQLGKSFHVLEPLAASWTEDGLRGMEVYHPSADAGDEPVLLGIAKRCGLLVTGGSDFHGAQVKPDIEIGQEFQRWKTMDEDVRRLLSALKIPA
ncbi:MAG: PHP domain-containing protein [Clostridia bacterium]|nr:PHP domain-containing protein [Clostridia bacterium]